MKAAQQSSVKNPSAPVLIARGLAHLGLVVAFALALTAAPGPAVADATQTASLPANTSGAQDPAQTAPADTTPTDDAAGYRVHPGDVLAVTVVDFNELSLPQVMVTPAGDISLPLVGSVSVDHLTLAAINELLDKAYKKYLVTPNVNVSLINKHADYIYINGYVNRPGEINYVPGITLASALAEAGGQASDGDLTQVSVTHPDNTTKTFDLSDPTAYSVTDPSFILQPNDSVFVPVQHHEISVTGEVQHPGTVSYQEKMTVLDAITYAGGVTDNADLTAATLTHAGQTTPLNLYAMLELGNNSQNIVLTPGDRINVPVIANRSFVLGEVNKPGLYVVKPGDTILDALSNAGGPLPGSKLGSVVVLRKGPDGKPVQTVIDVLTYLKTGKTKDHKPLYVMQQGDVVYVPSRKKPFDFASMWQVASTLSTADAFTTLVTHP